MSIEIMETVKQTLFAPWNLLRWFRLGLGLFVGVQAIQLHDSLAAVVSALLMLQAITNAGCCGSGGCAAPEPGRIHDGEAGTTEYAEIK